MADGVYLNAHENECFLGVVRRVLGLPKTVTTFEICAQKWMYLGVLNPQVKKKERVRNTHTHTHTHTLF